jgi:N-carbamoyl-L-amino-acid hydrolase
MPIVSGAGHDACHVARITPAGMIFVPCAGGISHNETESATPSDLAAGCDVLLHAVLELAGGRWKS